MTALLASLALQSLFTLDVRVLDAVEDGPIILEATITYVGQKPLERLYDPMENPFAVELPASWQAAYRPSNRIRFHFGHLSHDYLIQPGDKTVRRLVIHRMFAGSFPSGPATVIVTCHVNGCLHVGENGVATVVRKSVPLNVTRYSPAVADAIRRDIARVAATRNLPRLNVREIYDIDLSDQADRLLGTSHPEFAPLALDMLRVESGNPPCRHDIRKHLWRSNEGTRLLQDWDVETVLSEGSTPYVFYTIFSEWRLRESSISDYIHPVLYFLSGGLHQLFLPQRASDGRYIYPDQLDTCYSICRRLKQRLPDEHLNRLKQVKSLWLRAFLHVTFTDRLDREWSNRFLADLRDRVKPIPDEQIRELVKQLDAPIYKDREHATAQLLAHFDRISDYLESHVNRASPEASRRADLILRKGKAMKRDPLELQFLAWLRSWDGSNRAARQILGILAAGSATCPLTQDAKAILTPPK